MFRIFQAGARRTVALTAAVGLLITACGGDDGSSGDASADPGDATDAGGDEGGDDEPIKVGISLSFSGDFSDNGEAAERGYEVWADVVNADGGLLGREVELVMADDASTPEQVVTNYENFIDRSGVDLLFGPYSSLLNLPAGEVAARHGYAFFEAMGNGPQVFEACLETLLYAGTADSVTSTAVWADFILSLPEDERPQTAAYASLDDPFSAPAAEALRETFEASGIETVYDELYTVDTADLTPVMQGVANADPDMVVSGSQTVDGFGQVRAMLQLDFSPDFLFMANGPAGVVEFPRNVGDENTEGVFTTDNWSPVLDTAGNEEFVAAYIERFGGEAGDIDSTSAQAYAVGQMATAVVEDVGALDQDALVETGRSGSWSTVVGDVELDDCSVPTGTQPLFQWQDGEILVVYPPDLAEAEPRYPKPAWGAEAPDAP